MRAIDKLDRFGPGGVRALLGAGRKDESGDFTKARSFRTTRLDACSTLLNWANGKRRRRHGPA